MPPVRVLGAGGEYQPSASMEDQGFFDRLKASSSPPPPPPIVAPVQEVSLPSVRGVTLEQDQQDDVIYNAMMLAFILMVCVFLYLIFRWVCSFRVVKASQRPTSLGKKAY
jgi:hypothetical protein